MNVRTILDAKGSDEVFTIDQSATLADFVRIACEKDVGAMLVTRKDAEIVGIITERDILHKCNIGADFRKTRVADVMTKNLVMVQADEDIKTAMDYMITMKIRHLPVLSGKEIAGVITIRDLILAMRKADDKETRMLVDYLRKSLEAKGVAAE